ncbi:interaptin [Legionella santicrucis]|uniref:Interaptin n=2 Tax=Legionella santicrucis TaxID=45074 RepID=A0A0W0Z1I3_9GAMM|nr:interaptin [Legionella santicrucis]
MVDEAITSDKITVDDPLKSDIATLFDSRKNVGVKTIQDIHLKGEVNTDDAFAKFNELLNKSELSKQGILDALNEMNNLDGGMLWHTSRSGLTSPAKPTKEVIESMASHLFARIQYNRILALTVDPDDNYLKEQLEARKTEVLEILRNKNTAEEITTLFEAVKDQDKDKENIQEAMKDLGLEHGNDAKVKELFAEIQYNRIYKLAVADSKLKAQLDDSVNEVIEQLEGLTEVGEVTDLFNDVQDPNKSKAEIKTAMQELGLDDEDAKVKALFAENQYNRILEAVKTTNPILYAQLKDEREAVITALATPDDVDTVDKVTALLDAVKKPDTDKPGIKTAMEKLGLKHDDPAKLNELFAENQYFRILGEVQANNPKLHEQLQEKPEDVKKALAGAVDLAAVKLLVDAVQKKDKDKASIQKAMEALGLQHNENTKVKELFAENQYARILEEALANSPTLHKHLENKKTDVIVALSNANIEDLAGVNKLVEAVKNPAIDKPGIKTAMKELGLGEDDEIANELFAEAQHARILELAKDDVELKNQLTNKKTDVLNKLKEMTKVEDITALLNKLKDPATTKTQTLERMEELGLGNDEEDAKKLFAENQYKLLLENVQESNPKLYAELKAKPEDVIRALVRADKEDSAGVKLLVDAATKTDSDRLTIRSAIGALGLDPNKDKQIFAENQYSRILEMVKDSNPKLHAQLKNKRDDVIQALVDADVADLAGVNQLIEAVKDPAKDKDDVEEAMEELGLGNDEAKVKELFGENQYNKLATQMEAHKDTNPKLYDYYKDPVKRVELIKELGGKDSLESDTLDKIVQILLSEPGKRIEQQKEFSKSIEKHAQKLKPIDALDEVIHLHNPAFQAKARKDPEGMKKKYESSSQECAVMISRLEMQLKELEAVKEALQNKKLKPEDLGSTPFFGNSPAMDVLNGITEKRLKDQLDFYKQVQDKIDNHILIAIDEAVKGSKKYIYDPNSVSSRNVSREDLKQHRVGFDRKPGTNNVNVTTPPDATSSIMDFILEDEKPTKDQVRCFDVAFTHEKDTGEKVGTAARFTYDPNPPGVSGSSMLIGKEVSKSTPSKFEILQFPRDPDNKLTPDELRKAQIEFSMTMAVQILATLDKPPTKDKPLCINGFSGKQDEVAYLWTALAILGEKNPKMQFSPDALVVRGNSGFNPNAQRGRLYGFANTSIKATVFDAHSALIDNKRQDLAKLTTKRFDTKPINKVEEGTEEATKEYKDKLKTGKVKTEIENAEQKVEEDKSLKI